MDDKFSSSAAAERYRQATEGRSYRPTLKSAQPDYRRQKALDDEQQQRSKEISKGAMDLLGPQPSDSSGYKQGGLVTKDWRSGKVISCRDC